MGRGGLYTIKNKDTNRDYQKFVRVGDQKREIIEITIGIIFLFEISIHYFFIHGVFKSHMKKITPTSSANSHPKFQFDLSPSYINVLKNEGWGVGAANYENPVKHLRWSFLRKKLKGFQPFGLNIWQGSEYVSNVLDI